MAKTDRLWAIDDFDDVADRDKSTWLEVRKIRSAFEKAGGTDAALVKAVLALSLLGLAAPKCLRFKLFTVSMMQLHTANTWDEAFGPLNPKGKHRKPRKALPDPEAVWVHIYEMVAGEGMPLTVSTFEQAGEELGISARTCQKIYQEYAKENGLSLAREVFSDWARKQAASARAATLEWIAKGKPKPGE